MAKYQGLTYAENNGYIRRMSVVDQVHHHVANVAAITVPVGSILMHGPEILSWVTSLLGVLWYVALFVDRHHRIKREKQSETKDIR